MRIVCFSCPGITDTKVISHWIKVIKGEKSDSYRGICSKCGAEMILEGIESVEKAVGQSNKSVKPTPEAQLN